MCDCIDPRDACLEPLWTDYGLMPVALQNRRQTCRYSRGRSAFAVEPVCLNAVVHARRACGVSTIVCSSVNDCMTCEPPTRPIPLSVPARPPNGRCASQ